MLEKVIWFCVLFGGTLAISYRECMNNGSKIVHLEIPSCQDEYRCRLIRGHNVSLMIDFIPNLNVSSANTTLHVFIKGNISVPFALERNACGIDMKCPIKDGELHSYKAIFMIQNIYPPWKFDAQLELKNDSQGDLLCVRFPVVIIKKVGRKRTNTILKNKFKKVPLRYVKNSFMPSSLMKQKTRELKHDFFLRVKRNNY